MRVSAWARVASLPILLGAGAAFADSAVWKVTKDERELYLGGTIHVLTPQDYPLPASFERAYARSQRVVLETDLQQLQTPAFQQAMLAELVYADGDSLEQALQPKTFQRLTAFLTERGLPIAAVNRLKPAMATMTLTMIELKRQGFTSTGVDAFFEHKASVDGKPLAFLETPQEQLSFLVNLGVGREDDLLNYTLNDLERLPAFMRSLKDAWRQGDLVALHALAIDELSNDFPTVYERLIAQRNDAWLPHIEAMLATREVEFVLVGALHLVGDDGLLSQLVRRGYKTQRLQ